MDMRLLAVIVTAAVLHMLIAIGFLHHKSSAQKEHKDAVAALAEKWTQEDQERTVRQNDELEKKYGTNQLDRIALDSRLGIPLELAKLCQLLVGDQYQCEVETEQFTEFSVYISGAGGAPDPKTTSDLLKGILARVDPAWIYQIVFAFPAEESHLIVDQFKIQKVPDWKTADVTEIRSACLRD